MPRKRNQGIVSKSMRNRQKMAYRPRQKQYVPGWGGMVGRGLGLVSKTFTNPGSMAHKALRLARKVADAVNIEYKHFNASSAGLPIDNVGSLGNQVIPAQGTTDLTRIGDSIKIQNYTMRFFLQRVTSDAVVRIILLFDPQNKTTGPADVLENINTSAAPIQPKHYDKRFWSRILFDKTYVLTSSDSTRKDEFEVAVNEHTQFEAGTTTVNSGALKLLMISNATNGGGSVPLITYYARGTFTDD